MFFCPQMTAVVDNKYAVVVPEMSPEIYEEEEKKLPIDGLVVSAYPTTGISDSRLNCNSLDYISKIHECSRELFTDQ